MSSRMTAPLSAFARRTLPRLAAVAALALSLASGTAFANFQESSVTFQLTDGNLNTYTGPYASVMVDLTSSTTANITFTALTGCGPNGCDYLFLMGDGGSVAVNVNAGSFLVSDISGSNAYCTQTSPSTCTPFTPGLPYTQGSGTEDGRGKYNLQINSFDGWSHSSSTVTFTLTDTSGTWASAANVLTSTGNGKGYDAAMHFFPCLIVSGNQCSSNSPGAKAVNGGAGTGYASGTAPTVLQTVVPIPAAAWLFGSGLLGLIGIARRRRISTSPDFA